MFSLFGKKSSGLLGIDIGSSSVKMVALSTNGSQKQIDAYAIVPLSASAIVDGNIEDLAEVSGAIRRGLKLCGGKYTGAVVSVPSSAVITKRIDISNLFIGFDLEDQVKIEADQFIPYPLEEVALDFEVLGPSKKDPNLNEILLVACRKDSAESREEAVSSAGIKCEVVDVDTYAIERYITLLDKTVTNEMFALIDIGASTLSLNVCQGGKVVYNREQAFGGKDLIHALQQQKGISIEQVEKAFRNNSLSNEELDDVVEPFINTVVQQVSRALQFFYSSGIQGQLTKVYVCGGLSGLPNFIETLADELDLPAERLNPINQCNVGRKLNSDNLKHDSAMLVKACGLAMRSFSIGNK